MHACGKDIGALAPSGRAPGVHTSTDKFIWNSECNALGAEKNFKKETSLIPIE